MKKKYKYIFIVLVYKNTDVLKTFFKSLNVVNDYRVVLVNAYYDDISKEKCYKYAKENDADFIDIPNLGYGEGNNRGILFARENYEFDFIVVTNSDIIIKKFLDIDASLYSDNIIAPDTVMLTGKKQNPHMPYYCGGICYSLLKIGYQHNWFYICRLANLINRINILVFLCMQGIKKQEISQVFSVHGSFFIIGALAIEKMYPIFDSSMFLYNEELYLAYRCRKVGIKLYYMPKMIEVLHLEGASAGFNYRKQFNIYKESFERLDKVISNG